VDIHFPLTPQAVAIIYNVPLLTAAWWVWLRTHVLTGDLVGDGWVMT